MKMAKAENSSVLQKVKNFLVGRKNGEITPAQAEKIQKVSYTLTHSEQKKKFSPTYLTIAKGLDSEEKQLFEASVYYLARIAANKAKYRQDIIDILTKKASEKRINPEFREYIMQQIQNIS